MSVYITGGTLGFSLGPLLFAPFAERFGLDWTPLLAIPGLLVIAFFLTRVPPMPLHACRRAADLARFGRTRSRSALLYLIVVLRTLTSLSFATFVPVMLTRRGMSVSQAGAIVAMYLFASGARRIPRRPVGGSVRARSASSRCRSSCATPFLLSRRS